MTIPIDEAIKTLKKEILAQDWSLSDRRAKKLEDAFACLKGRFKNRKTPRDILTMGENVLGCIPVLKEKYPETIDFLKEVMVHVVSIYEDTEYDPLKEEKVFGSCYAKFSTLKEKIQADKKPRSHQEAETVHKYLTTMIKGDPNAPQKPSQDPSDEPGPVPAKPKNPLLEDNQEMTEEEEQELELLMKDLKTTAHDSGASAVDHASKQLEEFVTKQVSKEDNDTDASQVPPGNSPTLKDEENIAQSEKIVEENLIKECPPTLLRRIVIGDANFAVQENNIALVQAVERKRIKSYLRKNTVPLLDFDRFMKSLAKQFRGSLATLKDSKLKQLSLPVMVPRGLGLTATPDDKATTVLVVSNGEWNGVILCSEVSKETFTMVKFQKAKNGDIAGTGYLEDNSTMSLLNAVSVLRREGFMITG